MGASKGLAAWYSFFSIGLLAAGVISIVFSFIFREHNLLINMALSPTALTGGLILGIALVITFIIAVFAYIQRTHVTIGFVVLNWVLIIDAIGILILGTAIWFFSLRQRNEFHTVYAALSDAQRITIQDMFSCCGYFNATDLISIGGSFCTSQDFANSLDPTNLDSFCVTKVTASTDYTLENTFTSVYGFMAGVILLFMCSLCCIKERNEIERFKKIDAKRGGRGFV